MARQRVAGVAPFFALLAYGWRDVFVPLVVLAHDQHGAVLVTAGLAVAATRIGSWLWARYGSGMASRTAQNAALVAGLALVLGGLAPEEGPLGLVLWGAFGLAWPLVQQALLVAIPATLPALLWLLVGMALAGPMALGPGAWLMAAGYLFWAWHLGRGPAGPPPVSVSRLPPLLGALPAMAVSIWLWMIPARLLASGVPVAWCGVAMALGWAPFVLVTLAGRPGLPALAAAVLLAPAALGLGLAQASWQVVAGMAACSLLAGLLQAALDPESYPFGPPPEGRALGEAAGPLVGVLLLALAGPPAVFAGGAVAALASVAALAAGRTAGR